MESRILTDVKERLEKLNIYELRQVARAVGVHRPADGKKSRVLEAILSIAQAVSAPEPPSLRGAPPKSQTYDEQLVADIKTCREYYLALNGGTVLEEPKVMRVNDSASEERESLELTLSGILDMGGKYAFLRVNGCAVTPDKDAFVHESFINRYSLKEGDFITGRCGRKSLDEAPGLIAINTVNGVQFEAGRHRPDFSALTHVYPTVSIKTAAGKDDTACRMVDLFSPVALGQRAFISAPAKSGKTALIKKLAAGICRNYPHFKTIITLVDERPEDVTDIKRANIGCDLFCTTFDMSGENHIRTAHLSLEYAKRQVEEGKNVILLFDGITRLARAYADSDRAKEEIKKFLFCACNAEEGGSLTIISTVDSRNYGEYISVSNMCVTLSGELAEERTFPAIDVKNSYADGEERFRASSEITAASNLRGRIGKDISAEYIIELFESTEDNAEIVEKFKNG